MGNGTFAIFICLPSDLAHPDSLDKILELFHVSCSMNTLDHSYKIAVAAPAG
jgi:hypothetical protein